MAFAWVDSKIETFGVFARLSGKLQDVGSHRKRPKQTKTAQKIK